MELTSIRQADVDNAPYFSEAIDEFKKWFECEKDDYVLCSWGFYDKKQFESDCKVHGFDDKWVKKQLA